MEIQKPWAYQHCFQNNNSWWPECWGAFAAVHIYTSLQTQAMLPCNVLVWSEICWMRNWREVGNNLRQKGTRTFNTEDGDVWCQKCHTPSSRAGCPFYTDIVSNSITTITRRSKKTQTPILYLDVLQRIMRWNKGTALPPWTGCVQ